MTSLPCFALPGQSGSVPVQQGRARRTVVPRPCAVSIVILPPHMDAKRCAIHRLRPVPLPRGLVVKNAFVACSATPGGMPVCVIRWMVITDAV